MKNFDFQIADRSPLRSNSGHDADDMIYDDASPIYDAYDFMGEGEGDAYSLEDLLRLVQMGDDSCIDRNNIEFLTDEDALIWGLSYITETTLGRAMAFDARFEEWSLEVDDLNEDTPSIDSQLRILILPRGTPSIRSLSQNISYRQQFLLNLCRGIRMIWQDMNGVRDRHDISIDDQVLFERLRRADLDTVMLHMAWELRELDGGSLWRQLIADDLGNLVTIASGLWSEDGLNTEQIGAALHQIFQHWLGSDELLSQTDARTLDTMDQKLSRGLNSICGHTMLRPEDIMAIGRMPEGGSYLAPIARSVLYAEDLRRVPDPMLDAHMRQIIEDSGFLFMPPLMFHDTNLQEKIFPSHKIDTIV